MSEKPKATHMKTPKCPECGKPLSLPHPKERDIVDWICWNCGVAYYSEER